MAGANQASAKNTFGGWFVESWDKNSLSFPNGRKAELWEDVTEDHRTIQSTSHALGHGSRWTLLRCHLHSCGLVRNEDEWPWVVSISKWRVNRVWWAVLIKAWWKIDKLTCWTAWPKERARKKYFSHFSPIATLPRIFQQVTPPKSLETFWPNYRLSIVIDLRTWRFL